MANTVELNQQELNIQGLIGQYLAVRPGNTTSTDHLDQDTLSSFVEGTLNEKQGTAAVNHLVRCDFCRHISADLIRLELAFAEIPAASIRSESSGKLSDVLSGLFSKIFGTSDGAVFAHSEDDKPDETTEEDALDKKEGR